MRVARAREGDPGGHPAPHPAGRGQQVACQHLIPIVFSTITCLPGRTDARYHVLVSTLGHVSLLPLLFTLPELVSKLLLLAVTQLLLATTLVMS